jgi:hypothetical protein
MDSSKKGTRRAALAVLALAVLMASTLAWAAPGAVQHQADAGRGAVAAQVSAPSHADYDDVGTTVDQNPGDEPGTTDGDPDIPMDSPRASIEVLVVRMMVLFAALGL